MKIGKFQVIAELGQGANSTILHVRRAEDSRQYALKVVPIGSKEDQKFLDQARHEFEIAQKLDHPNLIKIFALETERDWLMRIRKVQMLVEYVNGKTLDSIPRLSIPRLVQIFEKVAAGLSHMHRRQVYHADLKPNNIMLNRSGQVKILDFGLAWQKGEQKDRVQGTPEYMAPEQVRNKTVNERTDIYNFGATMYRLVTWHLPPNAVKAESGLVDAKTWKQNLKPVQEHAPKTPPKLCELIHSCLEYNPDKRPERINDVQERLAEMVKTLVKKAEDSLESLEF